MNKKIIASALIGCMSLGSVGAMAAVPSEIAGTRYEDAVSVLSALLIMNGDDDGSYRLDDTIIRSEAAKMAVTAMGMQDYAERSKSEVIFDDVGADHWANGYINTANSLGLVKGDGDGKFRPNDEITYREAVAVMVRAAGYEPEAEIKGGFPDGYIGIAGENKLTRGVEGIADAPITRGNAAILTSNTLEANKMEKIGSGTDASFGKTDKTLLGDNLNTTVITGQITAVGGTFLDGFDKVNNGQLRIGNTVYTAAYPVEDLLGYNVKAYVKNINGSENEVILALKSKGKNEAVEISRDTFERVFEKDGSKAVEYSNETNKLFTVVISPSARLIYNGRAAALDPTLLDLNGRNAHMTLLDTDNDSRCDIVFVNEYVNTVVDYVSSTGITCMNKDVIKLDDLDEYKLTLGSAEIEPSALKKWDVLSLFVSPDGKHTEIQVGRSVVSGKISAASEDGYTINDILYKTAAGFDNDLSVGRNYELCLDSSGRIAALKTGAVQRVENYAFLTNVYETDSAEGAMIKIVGVDGAQSTLRLANKLRFNGKSEKAEKAASGLISDGNADRQLITYELNDAGDISALNLAEESSSGSVNEEKFTLNKRIDNEVYNAASRTISNVRISDSTIVFDVSDPLNIKVGNSRVFADNRSYSGLAYDMSGNMAAAVIVVTKADRDPDAQASAAVVERITEGTGFEGSETDIIKVLINGESAELAAADKNVLVKPDGKKLAAGDIIQYKTDSNGEIDGIRVLLDYSAKDTEFESEPEKDLKLVYGKAERRFEDSVNITVNGMSESNFVIDENAHIYSVEKNSAELSSFGEISAYTEEEDNRIFLRIYEDKVTEAVIIK